MARKSATLFINAVSFGTPEAPSLVAYLSPKADPTLSEFCKAANLVGKTTDGKDAYPSIAVNFPYNPSGLKTARDIASELESNVLLVEASYEDTDEITPYTTSSGNAQIGIRSLTVDFTSRHIPTSKHIVEDYDGEVSAEDAAFLELAKAANQKRFADNMAKRAAAATPTVG